MADPAAWAWLAILGIVVVFEAWAVKTRNRTLSQWLWRHRWAKWFGIIGLSAFIVHMLATRDTHDPKREPVEVCEGEC